MHSEKVSTASTSSSSENRKNSKPIMEKRRRARMNASLTELKSLLLEVMKKEGNRHNKMEKADILEMTVKQLRLLQKQNYSASANEDSPVLPKYVLGFQECASEVSRYMTSMAEVDTEIRTRLLNHLATYITSPPSISNPSSPKRLSSCSSPSLSTAPVSRPSSASEYSFCSSPDKVASSSPPPSRHILLTKGPACPTETVVSNDASSSTDSKQTASSTTTNVTGMTNGVLTLDPSSLSQIQASKLGGFQLMTTKMPTCQVAFVLPASVMTDDPQKTFQTQQSYMPFPIYAPTSQATLNGSVPSTGPMMTLMPDVTKSGISVAPMANMSAVPQIISFPGTFTSPVSSGAQILVNGTDLYKQFELQHRNSAQVSPSEMKNTLSPPPLSVTKELSRTHIAVHEEPSALRVCEDENVWRPW